jgi:Xaa-Pro dipeptidase
MLYASRITMHTQRLQRLKAALAAHHLDCVAAIAGPNLFYLTGLSFHLSERPTIGFFPSYADPVFVVGKLEESKVRDGLPYAARTFTYTDADGPAAAFHSAVQALLADEIRLGIEARRMRVMELQLIEGSFPHLLWEEADAVFAQLRMVKDEAELQKMRAAVAIAERALTQTLPLIKAGLTEREVATELVMQTLRAGSESELPFAPIVASGPNSALPHATVTDRVLQPGDLLTLDWGAAKDHYIADLTRTFAVAREPKAELKTIYDLVKGANTAGVAAARVGATCASVDAAARRVIAEGGYGDDFVHRVGHGLGLEGHEDPSMHGNNTTVLEAGMTFTIEPGIYLPGKGGVRIEDDVVAREPGGESLSTLPRDLQVIG